MKGDFQREIVEALEAYFQAVNAQKQSDAAKRPSLRSHMERLDALLARLPPETDFQLRHFLERKSYEKALAWLRR